MAHTVYVLLHGYTGICVWASMMSYGNDGGLSDSHWTPLLGNTYLVAHLKTHEKSEPGFCSTVSPRKRGERVAKGVHVCYLDANPLL